MVQQNKVKKLGKLVIFAALALLSGMALNRKLPILGSQYYNPKTKYISLNIFHNKAVLMAT